jgi:hypothetical protein
MARIEVRCDPSGTDAWRCTVRVVEGGGTTEHRVIVRADDVARLAPDDAEPTRLVRDSFAFLLEREPKESILREFELTVIGRYFPEYEAEIRRRRG